MTSGAERRAERAAHRLARRVRARWTTRAWLRGILQAAAASALVVALLIVADAAVGLSAPVRGATRWLPLAAAAIFVAAAWRRSLRLSTLRSAALLVDETRPDFDHLTTTLLEAELATPTGRALAARAAARLEEITPAAVVPWRLARPGVGGLCGAGAALAAVALAGGGPATSWARWFVLPPHTTLSQDSEPASHDDTRVHSPTFTSGEAVITPPSYTRLARTTAPLSGVVEVYPGSTVRVHVEATGGGLEAERLGGTGGVGVEELPRGANRAEATDRAGGTAGWTLSWRVTSADRGLDLSLVDTGGAVTDRRVIAMAVREDRPPDVVLEQPTSDEVLASAEGVIDIRARATDDFDVAALELHWIHSSGSGESFSFEDGSFRWSSTSTRGDTLTGTLALDLATLGLGPGDVLHLRAEAVDRNDQPAPGRGVSATRTIRIATDDEMGEVTTLIGFPIDRDREPLLSQRMILLLTEELLEARDTLDASTFEERSDAIADEQERLRDRVGALMFVRESGGEPDEPDEPTTLAPPTHEHDGAPILEVNQDLVDAYNAMWEASRHLRQAEPRASIPPQQFALERLQQLREGERVFARGTVTRPPLDLEAARGSGELDEARPARRSHGPAHDDRDHWLARLQKALSAGVLQLRRLASDVLRDADGSIEVAGRIAAAADAAEAGDSIATRRAIAEAAQALTDPPRRGHHPPLPVPNGTVGAAYLDARARSPERRADMTESANAQTTPPTTWREAPFVFATARYTSGDWDSAPLVPSNLIHSLAQYTSIPVDAESVVVDLTSPELRRYPFVFLTGHLPLRLDEAESEGLREYVQRGGFVFIDDHNHDIDGAFHRSVIGEIARIFGEDALQPLPPEHELYHSFFVFDDGPPITTHELSGWGDGLIHRELFAVEVEGRIGVLYSNKDYASEWNYHAENKRFLALDNTRFGVNILVYALTR